MKTAIVAAIVGIFVVIVATASCSINHRSEGYACVKNTDCESGRTCSDGFCVLSGTVDDAAKTDAPKSSDGGNNNCPAACTSCNTTTKSCTIDCAAGGNCGSAITCPAGYKCDIRCNSENACRAGIDCRQGASCQIACSARNSCETVACGPGACSLTCNGVQSCKNVACGSSCACDVMCTGNQACTGGAVLCSSLACRTGLGCTSAPALCHSCQ